MLRLSSAAYLAKARFKVAAFKLDNSLSNISNDRILQDNQRTLCDGYETSNQKLFGQIKSEAHPLDTVHWLSGRQLSNLYHCARLNFTQTPHEKTGRTRE